MNHIRRRENFLTNQIDKLGIISLISSIGFSLVGTIWAIYLESLLHNPSYVGFVMTLFSIIAGVSYIAFIPIIEKNKKTKIYLITLILYFISYLLFSVIPFIWAVIILGCLVSVVASLRVTSFGIILRDKSKDKDVSKNVGLIYTFLNTAWLIGPLIAGFVAERLGMRSVFLIAAALILISTILFKIFQIKDNRTEKKIDKNVIKILIDFLKDKDRRLIYIISGGITVWWVLIYTYIPIYIIKSGLTSSVVGYFLALIIVPLILLEYFFGKLTAKIGFKKIFFIGYLIPAILAILCFFMPNLYLSLGLLILASIGMAMLEPTTEAYLMDILKKNERDKYYGPYNTTINVNHTVATFLIAIILLALPFKFIFIFISAMMFFFALISLKIKNIIEGKKR